MNENQLQRVELQLGKAGPEAAAAVAFAAICRMGEIGEQALTPFARLVPDADDGEFFPQYDRGIDMLQSLSDGRFARQTSGEVTTSAE